MKEAKRKEKRKKLKSISIRLSLRDLLELFVSGLGPMHWNAKQRWLSKIQRNFSRSAVLSLCFRLHIVTCVCLKTCSLSLSHLQTQHCLSLLSLDLKFVLPCLKKSLLYLLPGQALNLWCLRLFALNHTRFQRDGQQQRKARRTRSSIKVNCDHLLLFSNAKATQTNRNEMEKHFFTSFDVWRGVRDTSSTRLLVLLTHLYNRHTWKKSASL